MIGEIARPTLAALVDRGRGRDRDRVRAERRRDRARCGIAQRARQLGRVLRRARRASIAVPRRLRRDDEPAELARPATPCERPHADASAKRRAGSERRGSSAKVLAFSTSRVNHATVVAWCSRARAAGDHARRLRRSRSCWACCGAASRTSASTGGRRPTSSRRAARSSRRARTASPARRRSAGTTTCPLLSYLWLRGRCRSCKAQFSARYLLVEALTGALFGVAWWFTVGPAGMLEPFELRLIRFAISAAFVFVMVVITFIDIDHKLILDKVTIPSIVAVLRRVAAAARAALVRRPRRRRGRLRRAVADRRALLPDPQARGPRASATRCCSRWSARCSAGRACVVALFGGSVLGSVLGGDRSCSSATRRERRGRRADR